MANSFLNRWSRRKSGDLTEPAPAPQQPIIQPEGSSESVSASEPDSPLASLDDVQNIDHLAPDFSAFMQPGVDPIVQQAAMKKMFSDPHFNIMDGLDIYIDDYSKPDPIPLEMLKRMVQSDMLNIFRKEVTASTDEKARIEAQKLSDPQAHNPGSSSEESQTKTNKEEE